MSVCFCILHNRIYICYVLFFLLLLGYFVFAVYLLAALYFLSLKLGCLFSYRSI